MATRSASLRGMFPDAFFLQLALSLLPANWPTCRAHRWLRWDRGAAAKGPIPTPTPASVPPSLALAVSDTLDAVGSAALGLFICDSCGSSLEFSIPPSPPVRLPTSTNPESSAAPTGADHLPFACRNGVAGSHHLHVHASPAGDCFDAACCRCRTALRVTLSNARIPNQTLANIFAGNPDAFRLEVVGVFQAFVKGILANLDRPVNAQSDRFVRCIGGPTKDAVLVMTLLGFNFMPAEMKFYPMPLDPESKKAVALAGLQLLLKEFQLRQSLHSSIPSLKFSDASEDICVRLGFTYRSNLRLLSLASRSPVDSHYRTLGCTADVTTDKLKAAFIAQSKEDPKGLPWILDALIEVAKLRKNADLEEFVAMERTKDGLISVSEITSAYRTFNLSEDDDVPDVILVTIFSAMVNDHPERLDDFRSALRVIAEVRDSAILNMYLETGVIPGDLMEVTAQETSGDVPVGLTNIGNTCYLNSLLQMYLTITPLRERLKTISSQNTAMEVDNSESENGPVDKAKFLQYMSQLFDGLVTAPTSMRAVAPAKELAQLALGNTNLQVGSQQDVNECMENMVSLLEFGFSSIGDDSMLATVKSLFYGKTLQTLTFKESSGVTKKNSKEEDFLCLIIDVAPTLYDSLDAAFRSSEVDYEGQIANRELSIIRLPPVLTFTINRVLYDSSKGETKKAHNFLQFPNKLFMDRYLRENSTIVQQRLQEISGSDTSSSDRDTARAIRATLFDDLNSHPYHLHAVFVHEGEAQYGHYRLFMKNHSTSQWFLYDDSVVKEVLNPGHDIFGDTTGQLASAYCLVYVKADEVERLVKTFVREPIIVD
ncbi:hypothetical protein DFJ73DRAFT_848066 [Zopfochytrium polystomum]|nr:hypothetical protein DFJ73DRAFT_848066 [Zopfochytrium polystomum]